MSNSKRGLITDLPGQRSAPRPPVVDGLVEAALAASPFRGLPRPAVARVLAGGRLVWVSGRVLTHRVGETEPFLELVVDGVLRVFVTASDGRSMTVRYCRPGALIGVTSLYTEEFTMPAYTEALMDTILLRLSPGAVRQAAYDDGVIAEALLRELAERAHRFLHEIPGSMFATVRQRVARHLLDLASEAPAVHPSGASGLLTVSVSQRDLADAVGTVREVVVRVLAELRESGVVCTYRDHIEILDPVRLAREQGGT